jgi:Amt family ammonium transporter
MPTTISAGDTAWLLMSAALVMLMTPALGFFYGGLVRRKNVLATIMHSFFILCLISVQWVLWGYTLAFGPDKGGIIGGLDWLTLKGVGQEPGPYAATVPHQAFMVFQMMFAVITPALITGAFAERKRFKAFVIFTLLWATFVYDPIAHWVWGGGWLGQLGALDFAGGTVVHINSGIAALMGAIVLGKRTGYKKEPMPPHSLTMTLIGTGLLWFGWFGFNAGSNLESNYYAGLAMANTFLATAAAGISWMLIEWVLRRRPSLLGMCSGIVAGLVAVTPAAGFAGPIGAIILGLVVSPVCLFFCAQVKKIFGYDDALDVFGIHCVGGIIGALGTGLVVNPAWGGAGVVDYVNCHDAGAVLGTCPVAAYDLVAQMKAQATGVIVTLLWSGVGSLLIWGLLRVLGLLRVSQEVEEEGLDINEHGEAAYHP